MRVALKAQYVEEADKYFWLREPPDGSAIDGLRRRVEDIYRRLPPGSFMMLDPAMAGESRGAEAIVAALPSVPEEVFGVPARHALAQLADVVAAAPRPPLERRALVERTLSQVDTEAIEGAIAWVAEKLGFTLDADTVFEIDAYIVADGVPLGGLTGRRIDDSPICLAAVSGQEGSTFSEVLVHEATHAVDAACHGKSSLVATLRSETGTSDQLWHAPYFVAAAEAVRRFVDPLHKDYGYTHGYYGRVVAEMEALDKRGITDAIRRA